MDSASPVAQDELHGDHGTRNHGVQEIGIHDGECPGAVFVDRIGSLREAFNARSISLTELAIEPAFDPLRSNPEFKALLRDVGLKD